MFESTITRPARKRRAKEKPTPPPVEYLRLAKEHPDTVVTVGNAAFILGVCVAHVRRRIKEGTLPATKPKGCRRSRWTSRRSR